MSKYTHNPIQGYSENRDGVTQPDTIASDYLVNEYTKGMGDDVSYRFAVLNLCETDVVMKDRRGLATVLKSRRSVPLDDRKPYSQVTDVNTGHSLNNQNKPKGVYINIVYRMSYDAYREMVKYQNTLSYDERIRRNLFRFKFAVRELDRFDIKSDDLAGGLRNINFTGMVEVSYLILLPQGFIERNGHVYDYDSDMLFILDGDTINSVPHPFSRENIESRFKESIKNEEENASGVVFIDSTGDHGSLFVKRLGAVIKVKPVKRKPNFHGDGVYIYGFKYDPNNPTSGNQEEFIKIDYSNTEALEKKGIFKTYHDAVNSEKAKQEYESNKFKQEEASRDRENKRKEERFKDLIKLVGFVSSIVVAIMPLVVKLWPTPKPKPT